MVLVKLRSAIRLTEKILLQNWFSAGECGSLNSQKEAVRLKLFLEDAYTRKRLAFISFFKQIICLKEQSLPKEDLKGRSNRGRSNGGRSNRGRSNKEI